MARNKTNHSKKRQAKSNRDAQIVEKAINTYTEGLNYANQYAKFKEGLNALSERYQRKIYTTLFIEKCRNNGMKPDMRIISYEKAIIKLSWLYKKKNKKFSKKAKYSTSSAYKSGGNFGKLIYNSSKS